MSLLPLEGKVYALTGGASGIGLATAKLLASRGATVAISDVNDTSLASTDAHFSSVQPQRPYSITKVDVAKRAEVDAWIEGVVAQFGRLDGAANIAGMIGKGHGVDAIVDQDDGEWEKILAVNLTGVMYCLRAELKNVVDGGSIVNVSSIHGRVGFAKHAAYDASKHGVNGLTKAAAQEVGARGIRVNAVAPGAIATPLLLQHKELLGRPHDGPFQDPSAIAREGTPQEVASVIAFLLGPESTYVSGSVYAVDGAWP